MRVQIFVVKLLNSRLFKLPWVLHNILHISLFAVTWIMSNSCFHFFWIYPIHACYPNIKIFKYLLSPYMSPVSLMLAVIPAWALPINTDLYNHSSTSCPITSVHMYMLCFLRSWSYPSFPTECHFTSLWNLFWKPKPAKSFTCRLPECTLLKHCPPSPWQVYSSVFDASFYPWF